MMANQQFESAKYEAGWSGQINQGPIPNQGWSSESQIPVQVQVNGHNEQANWSLNNGQLENPLADQAKLWNRPVVSLNSPNIQMRETEIKSENELLQNAQINATQAMFNEYQQLQQLQLLQVRAIVIFKKISVLEKNIF
jgi:hypothetical protein